MVTYIEKTFTSGTVLPALALNDLDANVDHVREESAFKYLFADAERLHVWTLGGSGNIGIRIIMDGATYLGSPQYGTADKKEVNIGLGGVSLGLHYAQFSMCRESGGSIVENSVVHGIFRFVRTEDLNYLSWWCRYESLVSSTHTLRHLCVIGHRTVQASW